MHLDNQMHKAQLQLCCVISLGCTCNVKDTQLEVAGLHALRNVICCASLMPALHIEHMLCMRYRHSWLAVYLIAEYALYNLELIFSSLEC